MPTASLSPGSLPFLTGVELGSQALPAYKGSFLALPGPSPPPPGFPDACEKLASDPDECDLFSALSVCLARLSALSCSKGDPSDGVPGAGLARPMLCGKHNLQVIKLDI